MANYTILLIDYEPRSIERFREPLVGAGYGIEIATDGVSGIEAFHRLNPDMVLVEAMIPKKHGFEVCQELKRTPHGRKTPVIITTGVYKGRKYRTQALHIYGCDEYIEKPIAPEQLLEIVGKFLKPGPSGSPPKSTDPGPGQSEAGGGSGPQETSGSVAKTVTKASFLPHALVDNDTEDEIMARLDAIMPTRHVAVPGIFAANGNALAAAVDPMSIIPPEFEAAPEDDPFAEIRAELNAELGAPTDGLEVEAAPVEPIPEVGLSDQMAAPSVLEALPIPETDLPIPPLPEPLPIPTVERPGQVVDFDTKRSRKNKKSGRHNDRPAPPAHPTRALPSAPKASHPATQPPRALEPVASVVELTLPRGTVVESELEAPVPKRGMPVWVWAVAGIIVVAGLYFIFSRDIPDRSIASVPPTPAPEPVASAPVEPSPVPQSEAPQNQGTRAPEPSTVAVEPPTRPVETAQAPTPKPPVERPAKTQAVAPPVVAPKITGKTLAGSTLRKDRAAVPPAAPAAPVGLDDAVAGVETLPDPTTEPPPSALAAGALIPIDEADTMPVSLSRRLPVYSAQARQMRLSGTVVLNALVNEQGKVDQVVLVIGVPGADLNEAAIRAAKTWTYRPATKRGVPVKVWKSEQIVFKR